VLSGKLGYPGAVPAIVSKVIAPVLDAIPPVARRVRFGLGLSFPPFRAGRRLLDVGCGRGWYVRIMRDCGWDAVGVEANPESARRGSAEYGVTIHEGTLEDQRFPDGSFDAVCMRHVFEHVGDPAATLREIRRILVPGGWLGLAMPNGHSFANRWFGKHWRGLTPPWHLHLFNPRALRLVLEHSGFKVLRVRSTAQSAHWVYNASRQVRAGTYRDDRVPSSWWFHYLEAASNALVGDLGEELEAVAAAA
jgi:SAM-dependent methyltransferase